PPAPPPFPYTTLFRSAAPVGDPRMDLGDATAGLLTVRRALRLPRQLTLRTGQTDAVTPHVLGIVDLLPGGQGHQGSYPGVDADRVRGGRRGRDGVLAQQGHEPTPGRVTGNRHGRRLHAFRQGTRPADVQRLSHLRQGQLSVAPLERAAGVLGRSAGPLPALVPGVLRALGEEVPERRLKVAQRLLERDR